MDHVAICKALFSRPNAPSIYDGYMAAMQTAPFAEFEINTPERTAALLATWAHECGGFRIMWESGNYSSVERVMQIFGEGRHSAAITRDEAGKYVRNPYALFERVYGLGNPRKAAELGNTRAGDGFKFRGCGVQQLTGRRDHERYAAAVGCSVDALCQPINSFHAALLEWREKGCNALADAGDLRGVRRAINGGYNGWEDFNAKYQLIYKHIAGASDMLSLGSRGPEVAALQEQLRARGFYESGKLDDTFGAMTKRALIAFQAAHELPPTGHYDAATQAAMAVIPSEPTLPGRAAVDVAKHSTIKDRVMSRMDKLAKSLMATLGLNELGNQSGFDAFETVMGMVDKVQSVMHKLSIKPRFALYAIAAIIIVMLIRCVQKADDETDAQIKTGRVA